MFVLAQLQYGVASPADLLKYKTSFANTYKFRSWKAKSDKWLIGPTLPIVGKALRIKAKNLNKICVNIVQKALK